MINHPSNYLDSYWYRVTKMGTDHKTREMNASKVDFEKYLLQHPSSETISVEEQEELASIISDKQNENKMVKKVLTKVTSPLQPGKVMEWKGVKWIAYFQEKNPNESYHSHLVVACNNIIRWINQYGVIRELPCYIVGSMMSVIKNNFRTWNSTITPQSNQFLEMLIPLQEDITIGKKFLISKRGWVVVDYDITSVPGIMYVSLSEDKIDRMDDDVTSGIAEYDNLNSYSIQIMESDIEIVLGETYVLHPNVLYKGKPIGAVGLEYKIVNELVASATVINEGVEISGETIGNTMIEISLVEEPQVIIEVPVTVTQTVTKAPEYILIGPDFIRLGMTGDYILYEIAQIKTQLAITTFAFDKEKYITGKIDGGVLTLQANEKGMLSNIILTVASTDRPAVSVSKTISIKSLW